MSGSPAAKTPEARSLQRHFGALVTLIQNPSLLTAELYSREIVSSQLLQRTNNPTLATDFKNIAILQTVISYLEVHPEKFSEVIEVLKGDPTLAPLAARIIETYGALKDHPRDDNQVPSFPQPPSAISRYADYLKLKFRLPTKEKWPCSPLKKTIEQFVIEKTESKSTEAVQSPMNDTATKIKKATGLSEILKTDDGSTPKCVLVEGGPGTGKSTLAWGACQGWANGKLFTEYDLVVLLKMREKRVREAKEVSDLFTHEDPDLRREVAKEVIKREGKGVLFIFEALDELSSLMLSEDSVFVNMFTGCALPAATILVTTRPWATKPLLEQCGDVISRHLELIGFTEDNVTQYIAEAFPDEQEHAEFSIYLDKQPYIKRMLNIPLNCAIVVQLYKSYKGTPHAPRTMTQLYSSLVLSLLQRHVKDHPQYKGKGMNNLVNLPSPIREQFYAVCELAFNGLTNLSAEVIFMEDELPANFDSLGLMQTTTQIHPDIGTRISYHFLHITLQEFLAAFHLSLQEEPRQVDFLLQSVVSSKYAVMLAFLLGLSRSSLTLWKSLLLALQLDSVDTLDLSSCIGYLDWLYESQNMDACTTFLGADRILFSPTSRLAQLDLYALGYCIYHSNSSWEIDLSVACSGPTAPLMLSTALTDSSSHATAKETSFVGSISSLRAIFGTFGDKAFLSLLSAPPRTLCGLSTLNLRYNSGITSVTCQAIARSLNKGLFPNLVHLKLNGSPIGEGGAAELFSTLMCSSGIQELHLTSTGIGPRDIEELGKLLMTSRSLRKLNITSNPLDSASLQLIASVLPENKSLQYLGLSGINFTTEDVAFLALGLQENHSLEVLFLNRCNIDGTGAIHLAEALKENQTLKQLHMQANSIGEEGARAFAEMLEVNQKLKKLDLSRDQSIQIKGAIKFIVALESNTTLDLLYLHKSCEPPELNLVKTSIQERCRFIGPLFMLGFDDD